MFADQIGRTMEVYIDDMLVKSLEVEDHISHLQQAFSTIRKYNMKLNPAKCSFGVSSGKFLGYIVTHRSIDANPEQIRAIHSIPSPKNVRGAGVGIVLTSPTRNTASRAVRCNFKATTNEGEYEALIAGLTLAHKMGAENIQVFGDSQLIINQVQGEYQAKDDSMIQYLAVAHRLIKKFTSCKLTQIPREQNLQADALANLGSALETNSQMSIPLLVLQWPDTLEELPSEEVSAVEEGNTWMTPLIRYLENDILPEDHNEARKIKKQAAR